MPELIYTALFLPCSFLGNVLGIIVWTNSNTPDGIPFWNWNIPHVLQIGADREIFVAYNWETQLRDTGRTAHPFRLCPLVLWFFRQRFAPVKQWATVIQIAFVYGIICYFLGTSVGRTGTFRLIGYSWPLYWLALPYLLSGAKLKIHGVETLFLLTVSLLVAWLPNLTSFTGLGRPVTPWLVLIPILYVATAFCLTRIIKRSKPDLSSRQINL